MQRTRTEIGSPGFKPLDARAVGEPEAVRLRSPLAKIPAYKEFWASVESAQATVGLESAAAKSESSNYWVRSTGTCWDVWSAARHYTLRSVKDSRKSEKVQCFAIRGEAGTYHVKETVRLH